MFARLARICSVALVACFLGAQAARRKAGVWTPLGLPIRANAPKPN
jgi:hypothetical protein